MLGPCRTSLHYTSFICESLLFAKLDSNFGGDEGRAGSTGDLAEDRACIGHQSLVAEQDLALVVYKDVSRLDVLVDLFI